MSEENFDQTISILKARLKSLEEEVFDLKEVSSKESIATIEANLKKNLEDKISELREGLREEKGDFSQQLEMMEKALRDFESHTSRFEKIDQEMDVLQTDRLKQLDKKINALEEQYTGMDRKTTQIHDSLRFQFESLLQETKSRIEEKQDQHKEFFLSKLKSVNQIFEKVETIFEERGAELDRQMQSIRAEKVSKTESSSDVTDPKSIDLPWQTALEDLRAKMEGQLQQMEARVGELIQKIRETKEKVEENTWQQDFEEKTRTSLESQLSEKVQQLNKETDSSVRDLGKKYWNRLSLRFLFQLLLICGLVAVGLWVIYNRIGGRAENQVSEDLSKRFHEDKVQATLLDAARSHVPNMIEREAQPVINKFREEIETQTDDFEGYLEESRTKYENVYKDFLLRLDEMKQAGQLSEWETSAMNDGYREAYELIKRVAEGHEESRSLVLAARAAILRIDAFYRSDMRARSYNIEYRGPTGMTYTNSSIPFDALISFLRDEEDWRARAKAANIMGTWKRLSALEYLLNAARQDSHLGVVYEALKSFSKLTGARQNTIFEVEEMSRWWKENKARLASEWSL